MKLSQYISLVLIFWLITVSDQERRYGCPNGCSQDTVTGLCICVSTKFTDQADICRNCPMSRLCDGTTETYDCDVKKKLLKWFGV